MGLKNKHGHWLCWMSTVGKNGLSNVKNTHKHHPFYLQVTTEGAKCTLDRRTSGPSVFHPMPYQVSAFSANFARPIKSRSTEISKKSGRDARQQNRAILPYEYERIVSLSFSFLFFSFVLSFFISCDSPCSVQ